MPEQIISLGTLLPKKSKEELDKIYKWLTSIYSGTDCDVWVQGLNTEYVLIKAYHKGYYQRLGARQVSGVTEWNVVKLEAPLDHGWNMLEAKNTEWQKEGRLLRVDKDLIREKFGLKIMKDKIEPRKLKPELAPAFVLAEDKERPECVTQEHLEYLDDLRESGVTNMFGAAPFIDKEFSDLKEGQSSVILTYWMSTFNKRHP